MASDSNVNTGRRELHWVLKIADRKANIDFFRNVLGMKVLRHEEFEKGCDAYCNGPYDGKWSKTMIGYGPESNHFVLELTYNYTVGSYDYRHDYRGMTIESQEVFERVTKSSYLYTEEGSFDKADPGSRALKVMSPDGYPFLIVNTHRTSPSHSSGDFSVDPVRRISLSVSNLSNSIHFWSEVLKMQTISENGHTDSNNAILSYENQQCELELIQAQQQPEGVIDHGTAFGRIAFACPQTQLRDIESLVIDVSSHSNSCGKVITPLLSLDTPGKATVQVVILADPDGYEICFVGAGAFEQLSKVDPDADRLIDEAMEADKSSAWYTKKKMSKPAAKV